MGTGAAVGGLLVRFDALPELIDDNIVMRPVEERDLEAWASIVRLPQIRECTSWSLSFTDDLLPFVWRPTEHAAASPLRFAIIERESDSLMGTIGFHSVDPAAGSAEVAYELHPVFWGIGIATRLCRLLTGWGHDQAGLTEIRATTAVSNLRSARVLERCEYHREGTLSRFRSVCGVPSDYYLFTHKASRKAMKPGSSSKLTNGALCKVVGGTHAGKSGTVADMKTSKTGHVTLTVVQANGVRLKTLAKNVVVSGKQ